VDIIVEEWSLTLGVRLEAAGMRSEFGSRVISASEDTTHPIGGDSAAESDETLMQRYQRGSQLAFHVVGRHRLAKRWLETPPKIASLVLDGDRVGYVALGFEQTIEHCVEVLAQPI